MAIYWSLCSKPLLSIWHSFPIGCSLQYCQMWIKTCLLLMREPWFRERTKHAAELSCQACWPWSQSPWVRMLDSPFLHPVLSGSFLICKMCMNIVRMAESLTHFFLGWFLENSLHRLTSKPKKNLNSCRLERLVWDPYIMWTQEWKHWAMRLSHFPPWDHESLWCGGLESVMQIKVFRKFHDSITPNPYTCCLTCLLKLLTSGWRGPSMWHVQHQQPFPLRRTLLLMVLCLG